MFKIGDKVVCINPFYLSFKDIKRKPIKRLKHYGIYTIENPDGGANDVELKEVSNTFYHYKRFILLSTYRELKLKKSSNSPIQTINNNKRQQKTK